MSSTVVAKPANKHSKEPEQSSARSSERAGTLGAPAGMPAFLQFAADSMVQAKCAECEEEERRAALGQPVQTKCAKCRGEEERQREVAVQAKSSCCGGGASPLHGLHSLAREGVVAAAQPLPHRDRIQWSFGRHDVGRAQVAVGGAAAQANGRMGSLAYTVGDRIAFREEPDVKLSAHEAAHVIQQRNGAKLPDGVGRPGDEYEQQADAVAEAVDRGKSAEPILDRTASGGRGGSDAVVQPKLEVNATREFEPAVISAPGLDGGREDIRAAGAGSPGARAKTGEPSGAKGDSEAQDAAKGGSRAQSSGTLPGGAAPAGSAGPAVPRDAGAAPQANPSAPPASTGTANAPAPSAPAGPRDTNAASTPTSPADAGASAPGPGSAQTTATSGGACAGGAVAKCYDAASDQPAQEPEKKPDNPPPGPVEEETSAGDEPEPPEPDDCPTQEAQAGLPGALGAAGAPPAGPAPASPAPATVVPPAGGGAPPAAPATPSAVPANAGPAASGGAARGGAAAPPPAGEGQPPLQSVASPLDGAIALAEGQRAAAVAGYSASWAGIQAASAGNQTLRGSVGFALRPGESSEDAQRREAAATLAQGFFASTADRVDQAIAFASQQVPDTLGAQAEAAKAQIAASIEVQKNNISTSIAQARGQAHIMAARARGAVTSQAISFVGAVEAQATAAITALTATHAATTAQVDQLETSNLENVNQIYADGRTQMEGRGVIVGDECTAIGEQFAPTYEGFEHCTENGFWDGDLSERRAQAQAKAARKTAKGYHDRMVDAAKKNAHTVTRDGRKKDRCAVIAAARHARETLDQELAALVAAIESARDGAVRAASDTRDSLLSTIDSGLNATLRQLDRTEHDQRQTADGHWLPSAGNAGTARARRRRRSAAGRRRRRQHPRNSFSRRAGEVRRQQYAGSRGPRPRPPCCKATHRPGDGEFAVQPGERRRPRPAAAFRGCRSGSGSAGRGRREQRSDGQRAQRRLRLVDGRNRRSR